MKAAVSHLEPYMEKADTASRGKILLATVKGDVHDIGKNLVEIILANNGFKVVNLGIKVPPEELIAAVREHRPDVVGLSGLLVKTAQQMVVTADDLHDAGIELPILVGGAALTNKFTRTRIAPAYDSLVAYAKDAMTGLDLMGQLMDAGRRRSLSAALAAETAAATAAAGKDGDGAAPAPRPAVREQERARRPPDSAGARSRSPPDRAAAGRGLGVHQSADALRAAPGLARRFRPPARRQGSEGARARRSGRRGQGRGPSGGDAGARHLAVLRGGERGQHDPVLSRRRRPDPGGGDHLPAAGAGAWPLSRGLRAAGRADRARDHVALFVTTAGAGIRELAEEAKQKGEYLRSHALQALALETAEAAAEWLHARLRNIWGFPDPPETTMRDRFRAHYRGKRYSFGYPACPELDDQAVLWELLRPEEIGVDLTEGFMMDPEASVSALVFQHPDAIYFGVAGTEPAGPPSAAAEDERELAPTGERPATKS